MSDISCQGNARAKKAIRLAIGKYLEELRLRVSCLTQVDLANLMGVHEETIQCIEDGEDEPSHGLIVLYVRFLDLNIEEFYDFLNLVIYSGYRRRQAGKR